MIVENEWRILNNRNNVLIIFRVAYGFCHQIWPLLVKLSILLTLYLRIRTNEEAMAMGCILWFKFHSIALILFSVLFGNKLNGNIKKFHCFLLGVGGGWMCVEDKLRKSFRILFFFSFFSVVCDQRNSCASQFNASNL